MTSIDPTVLGVLRDPVTLGALEAPPSGRSTFLDLRPGPLTSKNSGELTFAIDDYTEPDGGNYVDRLPHLEHPEIDPDAIVVDIGCGPRGFLDGLPGHHVFVDDIMAEYVEQLGATYDGLAINARTELLPFEDASIDVIYSINMIDHVDDMDATIAELARVLKPSGCLVLQSYWNSHPLLPTEPGVFDRFFLDHHVRGRFIAEQVRTHCVLSPEISSYYTMGILTGILRRDPEYQPPDRSTRIAFSERMGPQSLVAEAIGALESGDLALVKARLDQLPTQPLHHLHRHLLGARLAIGEQDLAGARDLLRSAREDPRAHRNPFARVAIMEVDVERAIAAASLADERAAAAQDGVLRRDRRIAELEAATERSQDRTITLEHAIAARDGRIEELGNAIQQRDGRISELDAAITRRSARIDDLSQAISLRNETISELNEHIEILDAQIEKYRRFGAPIRVLRASSARLAQRLRRRP